MLDGILDLLAAILVMGIVFVIAFSFILPLTNAEFMQLDSGYEDKGAMTNVLDYADSEEFEKVTKRMYTYEELMLLLSVQDSKMAEPKAINMRNLVTSVDLSYSGYGTNTALTGKSHGMLNINLIYAEPATYGTTREILNKDEVYNGLMRYAENHYIAEGNKEKSEVLGYPAEDNVGNMIISDTFNLNSRYFIQELNGSEYPNLNTSKMYTEIDTRLSPLSNITVPSTDARATNYDEKRIYHIQHHFALPNDSKYIKHSDVSEFKRIDDEVGAYFVEVEGDFIRKNTPTADIDTYAEYQNYLKLLREEMTKEGVIPDVLGS